MNEQEKIQHIEQNMLEISKKLNTLTERRESAELGELFGALAKAQAEMEDAKEDSLNFFFKSKYADLSSVVKASRPVLSKNGLSVIQRVITRNDGKMLLYTRLGHSSGQWMESSMVINPAKQDVQSIGSYITYLRRYCYASICGVVTGEDDDGEGAMKENRSQTPEVSGKISKTQLDVLAKELDGHEEILESLLKGFGLKKLAELPLKNFTQCMQRIREIKKSKEK